MSKKRDTIAVPDEWYYQSVENAELVGSYENQIRDMKVEIGNLEAIIDMQGEILASQGIVPAERAFVDFCEANDVKFTENGLPLIEIEPTKKKES